MKRNLTGRFLVLAAASVAMASAGGVAQAAEADGACGRISASDVAPRQEGLHAAKVVAIDGKLPGPQIADAYRVTPGTHVLRVLEAIDTRYLSPLTVRQRRDDNRYRELTVEVPADTTVLVAARLGVGASTAPKGFDYWEPVAWKQVAEPCH